VSCMVVAYFRVELDCDRRVFHISYDVSSIGKGCFELFSGEDVFFHDFGFGHVAGEGTDDDPDVDAGSGDDGGTATDFWVYVDVRGDFHGAGLRSDVITLFYIFANAFEEGDDGFTPDVFLGEVFSDFEGCFFAAVVEAFEDQEVLPLGRLRCF
jgi:hypothetical protein